MTKINKIIILLTLILCFLLIMQSCNKIEGYNNIYPNVNAWDINRSVNLPLTTTESCENMCGPAGRCSLTNEQCVKDVDCYGCGHFPLHKKGGPYVKGYRGAGKSVPGENANYSQLTTDIGTWGEPIEGGDEEPAGYYKGYNNWQHKFDQGMKIYNKKYYTGENNYVDYKERKTMSGDFITNMPYSANNSELEHRGIYI